MNMAQAVLRLDAAAEGLLACACAGILLPGGPCTASTSRVLATLSLVFSCMVQLVMSFLMS